MVETEDEYLVKASLPGIDPDDLDVTYTANTLTIQGETKQEKEAEGAKYHIRERRYGNFTRSISLPSTVDPSRFLSGLVVFRFAQG
ncbi:MAG: Hsp20/alpha crystallin family protein [Chloroflexota bacterium]|nr:Hsp20/alpha crystallin family protein [Chloroflexota bacterium]